MIKRFFIGYLVNDMLKFPMLLSIVYCIYGLTFISYSNSLQTKKRYRLLMALLPKEQWD